MSGNGIGNQAVCTTKATMHSLRIQNTGYLANHTGFKDVRYDGRTLTVRSSVNRNTNNEGKKEKKPTKMLKLTSDFVRLQSTLRLSRHCFRQFFKSHILAS